MTPKFWLKATFILVSATATEGWVTVNNWILLHFLLQWTATVTGCSRLTTSLNLPLVMTTYLFKFSIYNSCSNISNIYQS